MPTIADLKPAEKLQILLIAPSKMGKTFGAGTFPRPVFMDFDSGIRTIGSPEWRKAFPSINPDSIRFETFVEKNKGKGGTIKDPNAFDDASRFFDKMMAPGERESFDTWVVDSGTTLSQFAMNKAVFLLGSDSFAGKQHLSHTHESAMKHGLLVPKMQDYGAERSMVEQFVDMMRDAGKHLVFICHEKQIYDSADRLVEIGPLLTGQSVERVPLRFDEVWHLRGRPEGEKGYIRYLQTHADGLRKCGTRTGVPDNTAWNYEAILASIKASKEK